MTVELVPRAAMSTVFMLLLGCVDPQLASLDHQLADIQSATGGTPVTESPEALTLDVFAYAFADAPDPFSPGGGGGLREAPVMPVVLEPERIREPLESYALDELRLVGTLMMNGQAAALIRAPGGHVHRLLIGHRLGLDHGRIVAIGVAEVELIEMVIEQGAWVERSRRMTLGTS